MLISVVMIALRTEESWSRLLTFIASPEEIARSRTRRAPFLRAGVSNLAQNNEPWRVIVSLTEMRQESVSLQSTLATYLTTEASGSEENESKVGGLWNALFAGYAIAFAENLWQSLHPSRSCLR